MAKISRRAVASSSSTSLASSASVAAASSTSRASFSTPILSSESSSAGRAAAIAVHSGATIASASLTSLYAAGNNAIAASANSGGSQSANNIAYGGKALPGAAGKFAEPGGGGGGGAGSGHSAFSTAYPAGDPLRGGSGGGAAMDVTSNGSKDSTHYVSLPTFTPTTAAPYVQANKTQAQLLAAERERIRAEFFATYDVMTGVRIAATLGGFFGLMVFLIVWKSRSSSNETLKVLKDPKMAAVAAVCMQEEEEREIQEAMVATGMSIYPDEYDAIAYQRQRMLSLGNVSAPPMLHRGFRFSSVGGGGYSSLLEPPRRFSYSAVSGAGSLGGSGRRKSGSESSRILSNYPMGSSFGTDDYFIETEDEMDTGDYLTEGGTGQIEELSALHKRTDSTRSKPGFLEVPLMGQDSRRSSAMTCCSTESSYLERRCSAYTLGLANLPPSLQRKLSTASRTSSTENWDYYYPDIQVIQPTPKGSPCPSERSIYDQLHEAQQPPPTTTAAKTRLIAAPSLSTTTTTATTINATNKTIKTSIAANVNANANNAAPTFVRKHSIAYYDPESAQAGRKQEIHSISADTVDVYPYNQPQMQPLLKGLGRTAELIGSNGSGGGGIQSAPPVGVHPGFHFTDSPTEELRLSMRRKIAVMELTRMPSYPFTSVKTTAADTPSGTGTGTTAYENNNSFPYMNSAAAIAAATAAAAAAATATGAPGSTAVNSSSISVDSTPASLDKLNGSGSLGTISAKALFNMEKRAPLASLSSFKISSLEYQDSELRSLDEDSVFLESAADTDEDMQQLSSDSDEISLAAESDVAALVAPSTDNQIQQQSQQQQQQVQHQATDVDRIARTHTHTQLRHPIEKRYSLGAPSAASSGATAFSQQARRPLLQRHRTISASSSDRVALIGQQLREFPAPPAAGQSAGLLQPVVLATATLASPQPLETHFGTVICTSSPPTHPRRAQLLQQYSDPASLPTTTTTTTTTTTEEDTCSTLNTEVCGDGGDGDGGHIGNNVGGGGGGGTESATQTQYSSLNTVISVGRRGSSNSSQLDHSLMSSAENILTNNSLSQKQKQHKQQQQQQQHQNQYQHQQQAQLPRSRITHDPCASSISDSVVMSGSAGSGGGGGSSGGTTPRQPLICMPASLKNLILRGSSSSSADKLTTSPTGAIAGAGSLMMSRSSTNASLVSAECTGIGGAGSGLMLGEESGMPSVSLELPLIKLPSDDEDDDDDDDDAAADDNNNGKSNSESGSSNVGGNELKRSGTDSSSRDPSLPGSTRKWSKETLF